MAPGDFVNLATALLALAAVICLIRIFRGDLGDNKGGLAAAVVILAGLAYFIRTPHGRRLVEDLFAML
jgi:multisubunit Na+/H+ antiporter MnhF subunit